MDPDPVEGAVYRLTTPVTLSKAVGSDGTQITKTISVQAKRNKFAIKQDDNTYYTAQEDNCKKLCVVNFYCGYMFLLF